MAKYQYLVVPVMGVIKKGGTMVEVSAQLQETINRYCGQGWEFQQLGAVNIEIRKGCFFGLFYAGSDYTRFDQLIFRRES